MRNVIEGLEILQKYFDDDGPHIGARKDEIWVYSTNRPLSLKDEHRLRELKWFQPDAHPIDYEEFGPYDPDKDWSIYV